MKIDPKDLLPVDLSEFKVGGTFYVLIKDGDYARCVFYESDLQDETHKMHIRHWLMINNEQKKLFVCRERKWQPYTR